MTKDMFSVHHVTRTFQHLLHKGDTNDSGDISNISGMQFLSSKQYGAMISRYVTHYLLYYIRE